MSLWCDKASRDSRMAGNARAPETIAGAIACLHRRRERKSARPEITGDSNELPE